MAFWQINGNNLQYGPSEVTYVVASGTNKEEVGPHIKRDTCTNHFNVLGRGISVLRQYDNGKEFRMIWNKANKAVYDILSTLPIMKPIAFVDIYYNKNLTITIKDIIISDERLTQAGEIIRSIEIVFINPSVTAIP